MNFKKFLMIPLFAALPLVTGCGNDCKSTCEDGNDCPGRTTKVDCDKFCDDMEKLSDDADCSDEYDDLWSCGSDQDACKADETACKSEGDKYQACLTPYCTKNVDKCVAAFGGADGS
jgi:hypothetical protein